MVQGHILTIDKGEKNWFILLLMCGIIISAQHSNIELTYNIYTPRSNGRKRGICAEGRTFLFNILVFLAMLFLQIKQSIKDIESVQKYDRILKK